MGRIIGIDLGTTNSVAAIVDGPRPRVLENRDSKLQTRSVVSLRKKSGGKDDEILVGDAAYDNYALAPKDTIMSIKRLMGRAVADPAVQDVSTKVQYAIVEPADGTRSSIRVVMGGTQYSPTQVSSMILKKVKEDAEYRLGEKVTHAVVTVPAYFSDIQRAATRAAALESGLRVIKIMDEPTAAAIAFGMDALDGDAAQPQNVLVFDLGGGTFDISVLMMAGGSPVPLALKGDMWLGGDDFDQVLVDRVVEHCKDEHGVKAEDLSPRFMAMAKRAAQETKERLTSSQSADLLITGLLTSNDGKLIDIEIEVTRAEYEAAIRPLVDRTVSLVEKALEGAKLSKDDVDCVLMAGGSTAVPLVQQAMEDFFGAHKLVRNVHPKHCVAFGAALAASRIGERVVCQAPSVEDPEVECGHVNETDAMECARCGAPMPHPVEDGAGPQIDLFDIGIAPFNYGVQTAGDEFVVFIEARDEFPTQRPATQTFYTQGPNQRMCSIPVYGGDNLEKASANGKQGEAFAVLPARLPANTAVMIRIWLTKDGIFDLDAHLADGRQLSPWIVRPGEFEDVAVQNLEATERLIGEKAEGLSAEEAAELEMAREAAFSKLKEGQFEDAKAAIERFREMAIRVQPPVSDDPLVTKARNLINFAEFVMRNYGGWGLPPDRAYSLNKLVEETKAAEASGDRTLLEAKVVELDRATDNLPELVVAFIVLSNRIGSEVHPTDPALAANLREELDDAEGLARRGDPGAIGAINVLATRLEEAVAKIGKKRSGPATCIRAGCSAVVPVGVRFCPECGHDQWGLTKDQAPSSDSLTGH